MSLKIVEARKNNAFTRMQDIFDLSKRISDQQIRQKFLENGKTISLIRQEFVEYLEKYFVLMLEQDEKYVINYAPLNSFDDMYAVVNSVYTNLEEKRLQKLNKPPEQSNVNTSLPKLPKLIIPDFNGSMEEWPVFHQLFTKLIHENVSLSKLEKINYLVTHLKGSAKSICSGILPVEENYDALYISLVERYEDKRMLASTYLDKLLNFRNLNHESEKGLINFLEQFVESVTAIKQLNLPDLCDFLIMHIAIKKLDSQTVKQFEMNFRKNDIPKYDDLVTFIKEQVKILSRTSKTVSGKFLNYNSSPNRTHTFVSQQRAVGSAKHDVVKFNSSKKFCTLCKEILHPLYFCPVFQKMPVSQRRFAVQQNNACYNCLSIGKHTVKNCQSKGSCSKCQKRHHTLLHDFPNSKGTDLNNSQYHTPPRPLNNAEEPVTVPAAISNLSRTNEEPQSPKNPVVYCATSEKVFAPQTVLLATAIISVQDSLGNYRQLRALLDPGSQSNFITAEACDQLRLSRKRTDLAIRGIGSTQLPAQFYANIEFKSLKHPYPSFSIEAIVVEHLTDFLPTAPLSLNNLSYLRHLPLADNHFHMPNKIDILLGAEIWPIIMGTKKIFGPPNTPVALESSLGYLLIGRAPTLAIQQLCHSFYSCELNCIAPLMKKFWSIEELPQHRPLSFEEEDCENQFLRSWKRLPDGRFSVALPFKNTTSMLGSSMQTAIRRFHSLESRLLKDEKTYAQYIDIMHEFHAREFMTVISENIIANSESYFLPHHGVKKDSSSTPLRVVFNASMPTSSGYSLNDILHVGPKLQANIFNILLNFRLFPYALTTDISKMYLQIFLHPEHRKYQRIVWRSSPMENLKFYELNRVSFGIASAPYLAQRVVRLLAEIEKSRFPHAAEVTLRDIYIDDIATSIENEENAVLLYRELIELFKSGGFPLAKWNTSSAKLNQLLNIHAQNNFSFDKENHTKVLGILWNSADDNFSYSLKKEIKGLTKRSVLSTIAKMFDPLGLIAPVLTSAKLIMKEIWEKNIGWDEQLPETIIRRWNHFTSELCMLTNIRIPRHSSITRETHSVLIGFADASEKAYGAVLYVHSAIDSKTSVQLLCAKAKVAPTKPVITIPRLELCAALLLSKLIRNVLNLYKSRYLIQEVYAFSDSMVTLHWIHSCPSKWKIFVANRISQIQENLSANHWKHIRGEENPADCLSRGLTPSTLLKHPLWSHGPPWLSDPVREWPLTSDIQVSSQDIASEGKEVIALSINVTSESVLDCLLERCSSLKKMFRVTAYVYRILRSTKYTHLYINALEIKHAERFWIARIQAKYFAELKNLIMTNAELPPKFRALDVFLEDGVIRVGGRLHWSHLPFEQKHPVLLPKGNRFVELIIEDCHTRNLHAGPQLVFSLLRRQYWIISARSEIRRLLRKCVTCFKTKATAVFPKMAPLPAFRVQEAQAFINTGVDYCGPFMVTVTRRRGARAHKAYVCLFICLTVKAVHLELAYDLSTSSFLGAFKRFIARRGSCARIQSDNATNFIGARNYFDEFHHFIQSKEFNERLGDELSSHRIEWHFNPPDSPHFGGIWEANIKSAKSHLKRVIGKQILSYDEFNTILVQIEAILNSRPLCTLSDDVNAPTALTPSHFLTLGPPLREIFVPDSTQQPITLLKRYQLLDHIVQDFWKIWKEEYLQSLQVRYRWNKNPNPPTKGDVVLLKKENTPPLKWPMGIIEDAFPGPDGRIRVIDVRTGTGVYRRSITRVCPLPIH